VLASGPFERGARLDAERVTVHHIGVVTGRREALQPKIWPRGRWHNRSMARGRPLEVEREVVEVFRHSGLVSEYLVGALSDAVWRMEPPSGRGRTIAASVAHMQGVRRAFARMGGARPGPPSLDRKRVTRAQAQRALHRSTEVIAAQFEAAIAARRARVKGMPRRVVDMLTYLMQHDAHHRGQICALAKELGHEFGPKDMTRIWGWSALPSARKG
jgi:uncharacterized damage-inducible protein DinB